MLAKVVRERSDDFIEIAFPRPEEVNKKLILGEHVFPVVFD